MWVIERKKCECISMVTIISSNIKPWDNTKLAINIFDSVFCCKDHLFTGEPCQCYPVV